jgi:STE24 endopeptidase
VRAARLGWPAALLAALVATELAVLVLRPRSGVLQAVPVSADKYFSAHDIARARSYSHPQIWLFAGSLLARGVLLVALVRRPPARLRGPWKRPFRGAAAAGVALAVAVTLVTLPFGAISEQRARNYGLSTQDWPNWLADQAKGLGIELVLSAGGAVLAIALMRRFRGRWWIPGSAIVVVLGTAFLFAGPLLIDPLFNKFTPLADGPVRSDVLAVARKAGVKVDKVLEVDASRRTSAANAYVTGLGASKRLVLYDTLLNRFSRDEVRLVVAHELGHVHYRDVPHGLLYLLLVTPGGMWAAALLTRRLAPDEGRPGPSSLPALGLAIGVVALGVGTISNQLSRRIEARADSFSLRVTGEPEPFIAFERGIALRNVADPDPPRWLTFLMATHPPTIDRIGIARAYERGTR